MWHSTGMKRSRSFRHGRQHVRVVDVPLLELLPEHLLFGNLKCGVGHRQNTLLGEVKIAFVYQEVYTPRSHGILWIKETGWPGL